jgi:uncharacterized protein
MIRFIILFIIGYVVYRSLKFWMFPTASSSRSVSGKSTTEIDDIMIKDPFCEVYFPKRNGVHFNLSGKDLYFCSNQCKDKYLAAQSEKKE